MSKGNKNKTSKVHSGINLYFAQPGAQGGLGMGHRMRGVLGNLRHDAVYNVISAY